MRGSALQRGPGTVTPWDLRVGARALVLAALAQGLALLVTGATDEGSVPWSERWLRTLAVGPVSGALGTWLALRGARGAGELRAMGALGRSPGQWSAAAVLGGTFLACVVSLQVAFGPATTVRPFFPRHRPAGISWHYDEAGRAFVEPSGLRVDGEGRLTRPPLGVAPSDVAPAGATRSDLPPLGPEGAGDVPAHGAAATAVALALAGGGLACLAGLSQDPFRRRRSLGLDGAVALGALAMSLVTFHAVAAGRGAAFLVVVPSVFLVAWGIFRGAGGGSMGRHGS